MATTVDISRAKEIHGWMNPKELLWLAQAARACTSIVEFGSYKGRSTRALADHCPGVVWAFDPWDGGYLNDDGTQASWLDTKNARADFHANLADHIAMGHVKPVARRSGAAPGVLDGLLVDMVFIDGDHRREAVEEDIRTALRIVRAGGLVSGHDFDHRDWPGVRQAVVAAFGKRFSVHESIWWVRA